MSLLSLLTRSKTPAASLPELPEECGHWELAPRWDSAQDIGKKEKIVSLTCTVCKESFSPDEAARF